MARRLICVAIVGMVGLAVVSGGEQVRTIPLESVYSTSQQPGLKQVTHAKIKDGDRMVYLEPYGNYLDKIRGEINSGLTNVFLVRGQDINEAVQAASSAMV